MTAQKNQAKQSRRKGRKVRFESPLERVSDEDDDFEGNDADVISVVRMANRENEKYVTEGDLEVKEDVVEESVEETNDFTDADLMGGSCRRRPLQSRQLDDFFKDVRRGNKVKVQKIHMKKAMVKNNFDIPDMKDEKSRTAFLMACENNDLEMVTFFLKLKPKVPDVNREDSEGMRPLMWAVEHGSADLAELLVKVKNCEVNYLDKQRGFTPLYRSILRNKSELCRVLIHAGADVNLRQLGVVDPLAETPLIKAIQRGNWKICDMLLNSLCKKNARTSAGCTALHYAIAYRRYDIVELMMQNRVDKYQASVHGVTPMSLAIEQHLPLMVKILVRYGYDVAKRSPLGELPLEQAITLHSEQCAMTLVLWGCNIKRPSPPSYFQMAVDEGLIFLAQLLMSLKPTCLNEKWVLGKETPLALYHQPVFSEHLFTSSGQTMTLTQLSRAKILLYLGYKGPEKVKELGLPTELEKYVCFGEYFPEEFFRRKTLDEEECPFDCPAMCGKKNCAKIDFSRSPDEYELG